MREFYVVINSFAAPFFSDTDRCFVCGETAGDALDRAVREYKHPAGPYAAEIYEDANALAKGDAPLMRWQSNAAQGKKGDRKAGDFLPGAIK